MSKAVKAKAIPINKQSVKPEANSEATLTAVKTSTSNMFDKLKKSFVPSIKSTVIRVTSENITETPAEAKPSESKKADPAPKQKVTSIKTESVKATVATAAPAAKISFSLSEDDILERFAEGQDVAIIEVVNRLIEFAYSMRSSDIHIDPGQTEVRVRFRVDGILQDVTKFPKQNLNEIISRIKILAALRTDEHQAAQDGRFRHQAGDFPIDVRVSIAPTYHGENVVLRLLAGYQEDYSLTSLGFSESNQEKIIHAMKKPYGMILATGPTGSGKTTTLYTVLKMMSTPEVSIITIEDPIEYAIEGIEQIPVNNRTNLTFANGLRSVLRQDPNIIMVGEIRDQETAGLAVNTALTGHLLLSTLHTNDAATTLPRLLDLKIESYLIASTVTIAIGQRLVRKICSACKELYPITAAEVDSLKDIMEAANIPAGTKFYKGKGCKACNGMGYQGRVGIHEVLVVDGPIRDAILEKASAADIRQLAINTGMIPMVQDGLEKAKAGITTIEEVLRMLYD